MQRKTVLSFIVVGCLLALSSSGYGMPILQGAFQGTTPGGELWTADDGIREAKATFSISGEYLVIDLENDSLSTGVPNQMLAGLLFDFSGDFSGAPTVNADPNDIIFVVHTTPGDNGITNYEGAVRNALDAGDLRGEFGYLTDISDKNFTGADYGISATSLDPDSDPCIDGWPAFSSAIIPDLAALPKKPPDGADFALVGTNYTGNVPHYVQSEVQMKWLIESPGQISNVHFIYGTDYECLPIPEPATMLLLGTGLVGLAGFRKKFKK